VIVEYPLSPYADDALLSLAELEQARGDRAAAFQHLQRFVREHPASAARARAGLAAARLAFEQRDTGRGCAMIADARTSAGSGDVELRNQIEYYGSRCPTGAAAVASPAAATVTTAGAPRAASAQSVGAPAPTPTTRATTSTNTINTTTSVSTPSTDEVSRSASTEVSAPRVEATTPARPATNPVRSAEGSSTPKTGPMRGLWTIQLAAYNTRADAERLVKKLSARGVKARISGEAKPFRVRLDYYASRQAAAAEVAALRERGIIGFVTDEPRTGGATRP
jgi:cell division septation protein DedD